MSERECSVCQQSVPSYHHNLYFLLLFPLGPSGSPSPSPWWRRCRSLPCSWALSSWWPASPGYCGQRSAHRRCGSGGMCSSRSAMACTASWTWCASVSPAFLILTLLSAGGALPVEPSVITCCVLDALKPVVAKVFTFCT